jgi:hypothetical protein
LRQAVIEELLSNSSATLFRYSAIDVALLTRMSADMRRSAN